jgi:transcriptional regulator with XRE-family HTH domain
MRVEDSCAFVEEGFHQLVAVRRFNVSLSHYQKIERGDLDVRLSTGKKLADCFGITLSELLRAVLGWVVNNPPEIFCASCDERRL